MSGGPPAARSASPSNDGLLLLDADLLFAQRVHELARRTRPVERFPHAVAGGEGVRRAPFSADDVWALAAAAGATTVLITSESLLYARDLEEREAIIREIRRLAGRVAPKIVLVAIENPLQVRLDPDGGFELRPIGGEAWYQEVLRALRSAMSTGGHLIVACASYLTHGASVRQPNPATLLADPRRPLRIDEAQARSVLDLAAADDIITLLLGGLHDIGEIRVPAGHSPMPLGELAAWWTAAGHHDRTMERARSSSARTEFPRGNRSREACQLVHQQTNCSLKVLYRMAPAEALGIGHVADVRIQLGQSLGDRIPHDLRTAIDLVVPVPDTGKYYAQGLAQRIQRPYREAIFKQAETGRSFDIQDGATRRDFLHAKLGILPSLIAGKTIGIVDEAIFTGATLKLVTYLLRHSAVRGIILLIASPESKTRCPFNMQPDRAFLSEYVRDRDLAAYFDVDAVVFQDESVFQDTMRQYDFHCTRCFSAA
jgi:amidophosphoribosyltransferase